MKVLREIIIILCSLGISAIAGYFLYVFIEGIRLDMYCLEFREGLDCYQEGWVTFPVWLCSLVGSIVAISSIILVAIFCPSTRSWSLKATLIVGSMLAFPLTLLVAGPIPFLVTVLSGFFALLASQRLTSQCSSQPLAAGTPQSGAPN